MPPQISRPLFLAIAAIAAFLLVRQWMVPESFGDFGHYRGNALAEIATHTPQFAGRQACAECHEEVVNAMANATRKVPGCETCHGPSATHVRLIDDEDVFPPWDPSPNQWCVTCHATDPSRPEAFPQVDFNLHEKKSGKTCIQCHDPHKHRLEKKK